MQLMDSRDSALADTNETAGTNGKTSLVDWTWPVDWQERDILSHGAVAAALLSEQDKWIYRRVDSVRFNQRETRTCTSVDFEIPVEAIEFLSELLKREATVLYVPVAVLYKRVLADLDVRDEHDGSIPTLTRADNRKLSLGMLKFVINKCVGSQIHQDIESRLQEIIDDPDAVSAEQKYESLIKVDEGSPDKQFCEQMDKIRNDALAESFIKMLATGFPFFICVSIHDGTHRIFKFSYTARGAAYPSGSIIHRLREWQRGMREDSHLRLRGFGWHFRPQAGKTALSHHFEINAPPGFALSNTSLFSRNEDGRIELEPIPPENIAQHDSIVNVILDPDGPSDILTVVGLPRYGLLTGALLSSIATTMVILGVALLTILNSTGAATNLVGVVLAVPPGIGNLYFTWLPQHPTSSRLLVKLRVPLLTGTITAIVAASLALGSVTALPIWITVFVIAVGSTLTLLREWWNAGDASQRRLR